MATQRGRKSPEKSGPAKDDVLALALASGKTHAVAAKLAGVSVKTVSRRLTEPAFRALVTTHRDSLVTQTVGELAAAGSKASAKLVSLLGDPSSNVQLGAARSLLELTVKLGSYNELSDRIAALESRVPNDQKPWG